ncbi:hypothetical protein V2P56_03385 [Mycoplasma capricolum subsp. capricolum]|uniref:hypothetical protein n=1 Tax=Mycoplasma capricolum TaxID=2095 RepID=UPI003DA696F1
MKNKSNNILILVGGIISTLGSITSISFISYMLYVNVTIAYFFPLPGLLFKAFFNLIGLGLAITSLILSILITIPKFINNKKLILVAGILNIGFGFIIGGVLLIIGVFNMTNAPVITLTNTDTQIISNSNQVVKKNTLKTQKKSSSLKTTQKPFKYKELILVGLVLTLLGSIAGTIIMTESAVIWTKDLHNGNIIFSRNGLTPHLASIYTQPVFFFILLLMSISGLSTIKKSNDTLLILIAAISIPLFYPIVINAIGGILILAGVTIKKIVEPKTKINK